MIRFSDKQLSISSLDNLEIKLFVVGYKVKGESALMLFIDKGKNGKVVYSILIDSYENNTLANPNLSSFILGKYGVTKVDCIVWTHPHDDHTKGLDNIVDRFCKYDTRFYLPHYVYTNQRKLQIKLQPSIRKIFNNIKRNADRSCFHPISSTGNIDKAYNIDLIPEDGSSSKHLDLYFLAPIDEVLFDKAMGKGTDDPNKLSIVMIVSVDDYYFYFGGDTDDDNIAQSRREIYPYCRWVKIPHHSSDTASLAQQRFAYNSHFAACTLFSGDNFPYEDILNCYKKKFSHVFLTNSKPSRHAYGVIEFTYAFCQNSVQANVGVDLYGGAYEY